MGKFTAYKVELASLSDGKHEQDFVCDTEFFKNMEHTGVLSSDVKVHLDLEKRHDAYDCTFHCKGKVTVPCDRCLDPMDIDVDTDYHIIVKYGDAFDDESDELLVIPHSSTNLNVAYMLYDTILLTIPLRHVHQPGKCNRAMAAALSKHRSGTDEDAEEVLDEAEDIAAESED